MVNHQTFYTIWRNIKGRFGAADTHVLAVQGLPALWLKFVEPDYTVTIVGLPDESTDKLLMFTLLVSTAGVRQKVSSDPRMVVDAINEEIKRHRPAAIPPAVLLEPSRTIYQDAYTEEL